MKITYPRGMNMEEIFKNEVALKEEIARLEEENKKLLLRLQIVGKLIESIEQTVHITKPFGCAIFAGMVAVPIIPEGRFIVLITASLLIIPAMLVSYIFR
jgi:hypothetical protein